MRHRLDTRSMWTFIARLRSSVTRGLRTHATMNWALLTMAALAAIAGALAGGPGTWLVTAMGVLLVALLSAFLVPRDEELPVVRLILVVLLARIVAASLLHLYLVQRTAGGALFSDDLGYVTWAARIMRIWHGDPDAFPVDPSIVNTYVKVAAGLFWALGPNVAALKIVNTVLAVSAAVFAFRVAYLIAGRSAGLAAGAAMLLWPSLGLWSALTLKESYSLFCSLGITWSIAELVRTRRWPWLLVTTMFALPLQDTRAYLFTIHLVLWPAFLAVLWWAGRRIPLRHVVASAALAALLVLNIRPGLAVTPETLLGMDQTRANMAEGARSALVEATRTMRASDGQCFKVTVAGRETGRPRRVLVVPSGTTFVYADRETTDIQPPTNSVDVRPGDIVCVGYIPNTFIVEGGLPVTSLVTPRPDSAATPTAPPFSPGPLTSLVVTATGSTRFSDPAEPSELAPSREELLRRNLTYLPQGALLLIGAPFPWELTASRLIVLPEMLAWYLAVALAFSGLVILWRRRSWNALYVVALGLLIGAVLSLAEGNLGTLVRHRGMLVPYALIIAGCAVASWPRWRAAS